MTTLPSNIVVPLNGAPAAGLAACGAKAVHLGRMIEERLPVPPGFCITAAGLQTHLAASGIDLRYWAAGSRKHHQTVWAEIRQTILQAAIPPVVQRDIHAGYQQLAADVVAVRSSAVAEDLPSHSFAGQYDSFLGIRDFQACQEAIRRCWASLYSDRAIAYRVQAGFDPAETSMAVVVQAMVPADAAGVIFTANPLTGSREKIVVEAGFGLGEALVSGRVSPDHYLVWRSSGEIADRQIRRKTLRIVPDQAGGVREEPVPDQQAELPALDDAMIHRLAAQAMKAESLFGCPVDAEFAVAGGRAYLVQARPITTSGRASDFPEDCQVWTNANSGEVLPDVATPMTWSLVEPIGRELLGQILAKLGIDLGEHPLLGLVAGRVYFNLNTIMGCLQPFPGPRDKHVSELFGGRQDLAARLGEIQIADEEVPKLRVHWLRFAGRMLMLIGELAAFTPAKARRVVSRIRHKAERDAEIHPFECSRPELIEQALKIFDELHSEHRLFEAVGLGSFFTAALYNRCQRWFGDEGYAMASRILAGLGNNANAAAGISLWRLSRKAIEDDTLCSAVLSASSFAVLQTQLETTESGQKFLAAWRDFMAQHGHHCRGELELKNPRWAECPDLVLKQLKSYLAAGEADDFLARYERLPAERETAVAEARSRLRASCNRWLFDFLVRRAQQCGPLRENVKSYLVRRLAVLRAVLLELGMQLVRAGLVAEQDDIFFFRLEEIRDIGSGRSTWSQLKPQITSRREEYERLCRLSPPPVVVGHFDPRHIATGESPPTVTDMLTGVAVHPGVVRGPARVILRAGDDQVQPGEILVAPFTDPGWAPFFLNAAAIVMDMGGLLSHGSIIAREYGIPAVVNVGPATKTIRTGQWLEVDGTRGTVRLLPDPD